MIDAPFRKLLPGLVRPLLRWYGRLGITPNQLSVAGFGLACVAAFFVAVGWHVLAFVVWWASRLLDGTDGIYARESGQVTDFGGYLDVLLDMGSYAVLVLGFAAFWPEWAVGWSIVLMMYALCITSALAFGALEGKMGAVPPGENRSLRLSAGLAEGGETGLAYSLFLLWHAAMPYLLALWIAVLIWTVAARSLLAYRLLRR